MVHTRANESPNRNPFENVGHGRGARFLLRHLHGAGVVGDLVQIEHDGEHVGRSVAEEVVFAVHHTH